MSAEPKHGLEITLERMMILRAATQEVSAWILREAEERLGCLRPLLLPRKLLGGHLKSPVHEEVKDADKAFSELQAAFREVAGAPFKLTGRLDSPIDPIATDLALYVWEYAYRPEGSDASRPVTVKSPLSWVLMHAAPVSLSRPARCSPEVPVGATPTSSSSRSTRWSSSRCSTAILR